MGLCNEGHETNLKYLTFLFSSRVLFVGRYLINGESEGGGEETRLGGVAAYFKVFPTYEVTPTKDAAN